MAHFITRIQLHAANTADYDHLSAAMSRESFTIINKHQSRLSHEYKRKGETLKDINDAVFRAVSKIGKQFSFTVMKEGRF